MVRSIFQPQCIQLKPTTAGTEYIITEIVSNEIMQIVYDFSQSGTEIQAVVEKSSNLSASSKKRFFSSWGKVFIKAGMSGKNTWNQLMVPVYSKLLATGNLCKFLLMSSCNHSFQNSIMFEKLVSR